MALGPNLEPESAADRTKDIEAFVEEMMGEAEGGPKSSEVDDEPNPLETPIQKSEAEKADEVDDEEVPLPPQEKAVSGEAQAEEATEKTPEKIDEEFLQQLDADLDRDFEAVTGQKATTEPAIQAPAQPIQTAPIQQQVPASTEVDYPEFSMSREQLEALQSNPIERFPLMANAIARAAIDAAVEHVNRVIAARSPDVSEQVRTELGRQEVSRRYLQNVAIAYARRYPQHNKILQTVGREMTQLSRERGQAPHKLFQEVHDRVEELIAAANGGQPRKRAVRATVPNKPRAARARNTQEQTMEEEVGEMFSFQ